MIIFTFLLATAATIAPLVMSDSPVPTLVDCSSRPENLGPDGAFADGDSNTLWVYKGDKRYKAVGFRGIDNLQLFNLEDNPIPVIEETHSSGSVMGNYGAVISVNGSVLFIAANRAKGRIDVCHQNMTCDDRQVILRGLIFDLIPITIVKAAAVSRFDFERAPQRRRIFANLAINNGTETNLQVTMFLDGRRDRFWSAPANIPPRQRLTALFYMGDEPGRRPVYGEPRRELYRVFHDRITGVQPIKPLDFIAPNRPQHFLVDQAINYGWSGAWSGCPQELCFDSIFDAASWSMPTGLMAYRGQYVYMLGEFFGGNKVGPDFAPQGSHHRPAIKHVDSAFRFRNYTLLAAGEYLVSKDGSERKMIDSHLMGVERAPGAMFERGDNWLYALKVKERHMLTTFRLKNVTKHGPFYEQIAAKPLNWYFDGVPAHVDAAATIRDTIVLFRDNFFFKLPASAAPIWTNAEGHEKLPEERPKAEMGLTQSAYNCPSSWYAENRVGKILGFASGVEYASFAGYRQKFAPKVMGHPNDPTTPPPTDWPTSEMPTNAWTTTKWPTSEWATRMWKTSKWPSGDPAQLPTINPGSSVMPDISPAILPTINGSTTTQSPVTPDTVPTMPTAVPVPTQTTTTTAQPTTRSTPPVPPRPVPPVPPGPSTTTSQPAAAGALGLATASIIGVLALLGLLLALCLGAFFLLKPKGRVRPLPTRAARSRAARPSKPNVQKALSSDLAVTAPTSLPITEEAPLPVLQAPAESPSVPIVVEQLDDDPMIVVDMDEPEKDKRSLMSLDDDVAKAVDCSGI